MAEPPEAETLAKIGGVAAAALFVWRYLSHLLPSNARREDIREVHTRIDKVVEAQAEMRETLAFIRGKLEDD